MTERTIVVGGTGNVGRGVVESFEKSGWQVEIIDPQVNKKFEDLSQEELENLLSGINHIIYAAESGNREDYEANLNLSQENNRRFKDFIERVACTNPSIVVWYIGGSWTKRKPDESWLVTDNSPNKPLDECNEYEKAKVMAQENARRLSDKIRIRFLDWVSIVPNLAPNFSIPRLVTQAIKEGKITYSPGGYGRPLLEAVQAGEALLLLVANDGNERFRKFLIPGVFVKFEAFAQAVKKVIEQETGREIKLEMQTQTPEFLKTKTHSDYLESLGFVPDRKRIIKALEINARESLKEVNTN